MTVTLCHVEDSPVAALVLRRLMNQTGRLHVSSFDNPVAALTWCRLEQPDLVVLDYSMPGMDGLAFLERLRENEATRSQPVLMLTVWVTPELRRRALELGALDVVEKPFEPTELKLKIRNLVEFTSRLRRSRQERPVSRAEGGDGLLADSRTARLDDSVIHLLRRIAGFRERAGAAVHRIGPYAAAIAAGYGLSQAQQLLIERAAPLHDLGMVGLPDRLLDPMGRILPADREAYLSHTTIGHDLLAGCDALELRLAAEIALAHHENWDGSGYPRGLRGEDIPLSARIVAVADCFDQLTSEGSNAELVCTRARSLIVSESGRQFDPDVVRSLVSQADELTRLRKSLVRESGDKGPAAPVP